MLILNDDDVRERLNWPDVMQAIELGFKHEKRFKAPERMVIDAPQGGSFLTMPCVDEVGWYGVKKISVLPANQKHSKPTVQAWYTLIDPSGTPVLACSATLLTRMRTAATSAVAATYLAPKTVKNLLIIGSGSLAPWMALAHAHVREYEQIRVWARDAAKAETLVKDLQKDLGRRSIAVVEDLARASHQADVISAATSSKEALIQGKYLRAGQHLDLVGAFLPQMCESDSEAVKASEVFVDSLGAAKVEAGDLLQAVQAGWSFEQVKGELSDVVNGLSRSSSQSITLFKSVGHALEDLVVAKLLLA